MLTARWAEEPIDKYQDRHDEFLTNIERFAVLVT